MNPKEKNFNRDNALHRGSIEVDLMTLVARRGDMQANLTQREVDVIGFMQGTFTKKGIVSQIKQTFGEDITENNVTQYFFTLRQKLGDDLIIPIRKNEFRLNDELPKQDR